MHIHPLNARHAKEKLDARDFVNYLGLDLTLEPQLSWIAREMCCAPLPPDCSLQISKTNLVYFKDTTNALFTIEHPLTQRFLKVLERHRIDAIAGRGKPHVCKLEWNEPDIEFFTEFSHLQVSCSDCSLCQSRIFCDQCVSSYCETCFELLHATGAREQHTSRPTASGSMCSYCTCKQPQVFCSDCKEYFCFKCFEQLHRRGKRSEHQAMHIIATNGNIPPSGREICDECRDESASVRCDMCQDAFCLVCFWKCHLNGNRRHHSATQLTVRPLCNQCDKTRATLFCEQCQELLCSACFGDAHLKGGRKLHLFTDASNILLLLEKLDPGYQEFLKEARRKVMWAITKVQALTRGRQARNRYIRRKDLVTVIQKNWRGGQARRRMLGMLDQLNWRKGEVLSQIIHGKSNHDEEMKALDSRIKVAAKDQARSMVLLKSGLVLSPRNGEPTDTQNIRSAAFGINREHSSPEVKSRLIKNAKESDKLRRLLSINVPDTT